MKKLIIASLVLVSVLSVFTVGADPAAGYASRKWGIQPEMGMRIPADSLSPVIGGGVAGFFNVTESLTLRCDLDFASSKKTDMDLFAGASIGYIFPFLRHRIDVIPYLGCGFTSVTQTIPALYKAALSLSNGTASSKALFCPYAGIELRCFLTDSIALGARADYLFTSSHDTWEADGYLPLNSSQLALPEFRHPRIGIDFVATYLFR
jgi:hypothetical protein